MDRIGPAASRIMRAHSHAHGFTMVELMVAVAVLAILLAVAVPSYQAAARSSQLRSLASDLVASAFLARSEAIKRNTPVTLCGSTDGLECDDDAAWEVGWIIGCPTAAGQTNCVPGGAEWLVIQRQHSAPPRMQVTASEDRVVFQPTGVGATTATVTICRSGDSSGDPQRTVQIDAGGRPSSRIGTLGADGCP